MRNDFVRVIIYGLCRFMALLVRIYELDLVQVFVIRLLNVPRS